MIENESGELPEDLQTLSNYPSLPETFEADDFKDFQIVEIKEKEYKPTIVFEETQNKITAPSLV